MGVKLDGLSAVSEVRPELRDVIRSKLGVQVDVIFEALKHQIQGRGMNYKSVKAIDHQRSLPYCGLFHSIFNATFLWPALHANRSAGCLGQTGRRVASLILFTL